jgi:hypothetical protein
MINKGKKLINPLGKCNRGSVHRVTAEDITLVDTVAAQNFEYKVWLVHIGFRPREFRPLKKKKCADAYIAFSSIRCPTSWISRSRLCLDIQGFCQGPFHLTDSKPFKADPCRNISAEITVSPTDSGKMGSTEWVSSRRTCSWPRIGFCASNWLPKLERSGRSLM